jgi:hypothetical protein
MVKSTFERRTNTHSFNRKHSFRNIFCGNAVFLRFRGQSNAGLPHGSASGDCAVKITVKITVAMPKEITHWLIADEVLRHPDLKCVAGQYRDNDLRHIVYLGAILHDASYYTLGRKRSRALQLADRLHGASGEDTFELLRFALPMLRSEPNNYALRAFLFGATTHICADGIFHPYIYWYSGNLFASPHHAWQRHRALESALDLAFGAYFCKDFALDTFRLHEYLRRADLILPELLQAIPLLTGFVEEILSGYHTLTRVRRFATNTIFRSLTERINPHLPISAQAYTALCYPTALPPQHRITTTLSYCHPVTGEVFAVSLQEMFEAAVQESVRVWEAFEKCVLEGVQFDECGRSLEVGIHGIPSSAMRHFVLLTELER